MLDKQFTAIVSSKYEISIRPVKRLFFYFEIIYSSWCDFYIVLYTDKNKTSTQLTTFICKSMISKHNIIVHELFFAPWLKKNQIYGFMIWFIPFKFISIQLYEMEGEFKWKIWYAWTVDITNNKIIDIQWTWLIKSC